MALPILVKVTGKSVKFIDGYSIFFCAGKQGYSIVEQSMAGTEGGGRGEEEQRTRRMLLHSSFWRLSSFSSFLYPLPQIPILSAGAE